MSKITQTGWVAVCPKNNREVEWRAQHGPWWCWAAMTRGDAIANIIRGAGAPWPELYRRGWRIRKCCAL